MSRVDVGGAGFSEKMGFRLIEVISLKKNIFCQQFSVFLWFKIRNTMTWFHVSVLSDLLLIKQINFS